MTDTVAEPQTPMARRRRWLWVTGSALVLALAVAVALTWSPGDRDPAVDRTSGKRAPTFSVPDLRDPNRVIKLADFEGRQVVLNFWASWCVPCRREMPAFQAVFAEYGGRVAFVGMNHQDGRDDALELLAETGVRYPSGYDPEGKVARAYGLFGMPTTVLISADGLILATRIGEVSARELRQLINGPRER